MHTVTFPRAAYRHLVALANAANARRRAEEPRRWAAVSTWERIPRCWRTDLRVVGQSDLEVG